MEPHPLGLTMSAFGDHSPIERELVIGHFASGAGEKDPQTVNLTGAKWVAKRGLLVGRDIFNCGLRIADCVLASNGRKKIYRGDEGQAKPKAESGKREEKKKKTKKTKKISP